MSKILEQLFEGSKIDFKESIHARLYELADEALSERKKHIAAIYFSEKIDDQEEDLQVLKQGDDCDSSDGDDEEDKKKSNNDD